MGEPPSKCPHLLHSSQGEVSGTDGGQASGGEGGGRRDASRAAPVPRGAPAAGCPVSCCRSGPPPPSSAWPCVGTHTDGRTDGTRSGAPSPAPYTAPPHPQTGPTRIPPPQIAPPPQCTPLHPPPQGALPPDNTPKQTPFPTGLGPPRTHLPRHAGPYRVRATTGSQRQCACATVRPKLPGMTPRRPSLLRARWARQ